MWAAVATHSSLMMNPVRLAEFCNKTKIIEWKSSSSLKQWSSEQKELRRWWEHSRAKLECRRYRRWWRAMGCLLPVCASVVRIAGASNSGARRSNNCWRHSKRRLKRSKNKRNTSYCDISCNVLEVLCIILRSVMLWTFDDVSNAGLGGKCQESYYVCAHDVIDGYFGEGRSLRETKLSNKFAKQKNLLD